jgi:hypothetical protein
MTWIQFIPIEILFIIQGAIIGWLYAKVKIKNREISELQKALGHQHERT